MRSCSITSFCPTMNFAISSRDFLVRVHEQRGGGLVVELGFLAGVSVVVMSVLEKVVEKVFLWQRKRRSAGNVERRQNPVRLEQSARLTSQRSQGSGSIHTGGVQMAGCAANCQSVPVDACCRRSEPAKAAGAGVAEFFDAAGKSLFLHIGDNALHGMPRWSRGGRRRCCHSARRPGTRRDVCGACRDRSRMAAAFWKNAEPVPCGHVEHFRALFGVQRRGHRCLHAAWRSFSSSLSSSICTTSLPAFLGNSEHAFDV